MIDEHEIQRVLFDARRKGGRVQVRGGQYYIEVPDSAWTAGYEVSRPDEGTK